ncbi:MAG: phosphate ABC transporter substrate-binding protein [Firmicutes bacterium]|nr:phosphate ABC transporter substrate-binding protein [Bacillota bacterium]
MTTKKQNKRIAAAAALMVLAGCLAMTGCGGNKEDAPSGERDSIIIAGSTSVQALSEELAEAYMEKNQNATVEVQGGGSGQGIKSVEKGIADIGSLSREVKEEEKAAVSREFLAAKDGIAVIVNSKTGIKELSMKEIQQIYKGEVTNWKELGGMDKPITVVTREAGSGTRSSFTELAGITQKDDSGKELDGILKDALVQPSTGAVKETVSNTPYSIGYVSLNALDDKVAAVRVEGIEPSVETVLSGDYKIQRPFVYVAGTGLSSGAEDFIRFVMSSEGQKIVEESGFIPIKQK